MNLQNDEMTTADANNEIELNDLLLTAMQESDIKAGCIGCNWGPPLTNHNETVAEDQDTIVEDLVLTESESSTIKGGPHSGEDLLIGGQTSYDVKAPRHSKSI